MHDMRADGWFIYEKPIGGLSDWHEARSTRRDGFVLNQVLGNMTNLSFSLFPLGVRPDARAKICHFHGKVI